MRKMNKYVLTIIGSFNSQEECQEIALTLTPIVDSPHLKFQHTKGTLIFHFASEVSKSEIFDYVGGILYGITEAYILTELHDNMTLSMPKDIKEHLLDLDNTTEDAEMNLDMNRVKKNLDFNEDEEDDNDIVALLLGQKHSFHKKPSLDQILDKMIDKGYDKLTEHEKETLENYSKN